MVSLRVCTTVRRYVMGQVLRRNAHAKCRANNAQLSPIPWLERSALLKPDKTAVKYGDDVALTYSELMVRVVSRWWRQDSYMCSFCVVVESLCSVGFRSKLQMTEIIQHAAVL